MILWASGTSKKIIWRHILEAVGNLKQFLFSVVYTRFGNLEGLRILEEFEKGSVVFKGFWYSQNNFIVPWLVVLVLWSQIVHLCHS